MKNHLRVCCATILAAWLVGFTFVLPRNVSAQGCTNLIQDYNFEVGDPWPAWTVQTSANFGTPMCDVPTCGTGGGAAPARDGGNWAWFGGIPAPETATLGQSVTIPSGMTATLRFWMRIGTVSNPFTDTLTVSVDGVIQTTFTEPSVAEATYTLRTINLNAFANGASHAILFSYNGPTSGTASFVVDQVTLAVCAPTASQGSVNGRITGADGSPLGGTVMQLNGAASHTTITNANGNYHFDDLDTGGFYTVEPRLANYHFSPASRSFSLVGNQTDAGFTANADASVNANAIDTNEYFVRQQYLDFLGREPDGAGFEYWTGQINQCNGDAACIHQKRIDVSAAFFDSPEFQQTGSYIYRLYSGGLGRQVNYGEFSADRAQVIGGSNLDAAKTAYTNAFVQRPEFVSRYQTNPTAESFVDALLGTVAAKGTDLSSERGALIAAYNSGSSLTESRGLAVRAMGDSKSFTGGTYNQAFVLMEYFGYLRRGADTGGYDFWLNAIDGREAGNYRGMVCAFLTSGEYQGRFSTLITHSNSECGP